MSKEKRDERMELKFVSIHFSFINNLLFEFFLTQVLLNINSFKNFFLSQNDRSCETRLEEENRSVGSISCVRVVLQ
jgi:hypothetical protein